MRIHLVVVFFLVAGFPPILRAAPPAGGLDIADVSKWPLETVTRRDGRSFSGLIRHEDEAELELVEVVRRPGRPMFLLVRPLRKAELTEIVRLDPTEREALEQRIDAFRNRTAILAALAEDVRLTERRTPTARYLHYEGPWFSLDSTAADPVTREAIVRIEQTFAGYRTLLRPRRTPPRPLGILLFGSVKEYHDYLAALGLRIKNPAFFDPQRNLIVAGGDLAAFAARLREARTHHQQLLSSLRQKDERMQQLARELSQSLEQAGANPDKRRQVITAARQQWQDQRQSLVREVRRAQKDNTELYYRQFSRLYHEAFHAYLDNYVFDQKQYDVPRWLNEGWAQIFESGLVDGNTLRLDAPRADLLAALAGDLRGEAPLSLLDVLSAPPAEFLVGHQDMAASASRLYRYSWGLAYYLTFHRQLLGTSRMEEYLRREAGERNPTARFEKLVGQPLGAFEVQWRQAMLDAKPGG